MTGAVSIKGGKELWKFKAPSGIIGNAGRLPDPNPY
jgi:hypothetical protein